MMNIKQIFYINQKKYTYLINILNQNFQKLDLKKIYDFILESIRYIQDFYKLKRKPYTRYVPYLHNFYQEKDSNIPIIQNFKENKDLILDQKTIDKLNELYIKYSDSKKIINESKNIKSDNINIKPVDDEEILNKYYYFNKSKNQYFKKTRYCQFNNCYKISNFKDNNKNYCTEHSNNNAVNINNKSKVIKCNYNNCKKNIKSNNRFCQNHKYKCNDNECDIRIMKNDFYCKFHK